MKSMFIVLLNGQIDTAQFPSLDNCYCKYSYVYGNDWEQVSGLEEGLSARCERAPKRDCIVIGLPIEATFTSTNPFRCKWYFLFLVAFFFFSNKSFQLSFVARDDPHRSLSISDLLQAEPQYFKDSILDRLYFFIKEIGDKRARS
uniref:B9 domain-containing protein 1 n=1 Tax=Ascaris lumbricoides TaxID=6252 RepID=A0A0M3IU82_ASCLU